MIHKSVSYDSQVRELLRIENRQRVKGQFLQSVDWGACPYLFLSHLPFKHLFPLIEH